MSKLLVVVLVALFSVHFISEVFVEDKRLQRLLNNLSFVGLVLWFLIAIVGVIVFGV